MYAKQRIDILEKEFGCNISEITSDIYTSRGDRRITQIIGTLSQTIEEGESIPFQTGMVSYADELLRRGVHWLYHSTYEIDIVLLSNMLLYMPKVKVFFPYASIDESVDPDLKTFFSSLSLESEMQQLRKVSELVNVENLIWEPATSRLVSSHQLESVEERVIEQSSDPVIRSILDLSEPFPNEQEMSHRDEWEYAHNYESIKYADPLIQLYDDIVVAALSDEVVLITNQVLDRLISEPCLFSDTILTKDIKVLFRCSLPWFDSILSNEQYRLIFPLCEKFLTLLAEIPKGGKPFDITNVSTVFQNELDKTKIILNKQSIQYSLKQVTLYQREYQIDRPNKNINIFILCFIQ